MQRLRGLVAEGRHEDRQHPKEEGNVWEQENDEERRWENAFGEEFEPYGEAGEAVEASRRAEASASGLGVTIEDADDDAELYEDYAADDDLLEQLTRGLEVHAVADAVAGESLSPKICGRTLRTWAREYLDDGMFMTDMRGLWKPEHLLDDEDVLERVRRFMREKAKSYGEEGLSKERMLKFINDELLPAMMEEEDEDGGGKRFASIITRTMTPREDGTYKISLETARLWMHRAGAERGYFRNDKFTDVHEREDVVADRIQYLKKARPPRAFSGRSQPLPSRFASFCRVRKLVPARVQLLQSCWTKKKLAAAADCFCRCLYLRTSSSTYVRRFGSR